MQKIHLIIPARYQSTVYQASLYCFARSTDDSMDSKKALKASFVDTVCVATDDDRVYQDLRRCRHTCRHD